MVYGLENLNPLSSVTFLLYSNFVFESFSPELLSKLLCQLIHDSMTIVLNSFKGGQVAVLLQHTAGTAVGAHCLSIGLKLQTLI